MDQLKPGSWKKSILSFRDLTIQLHNETADIVDASKLLHLHQSALINYQEELIKAMSTKDPQVIFLLIDKIKHLHGKN